ncbi:hypothetical protein B7P43_G15147 [Cryptotermes secundus]|nr:uncharacterized protein LOC111861246 isoform X1 [Cryptotermes secundus]PNF43678.1 hypothetical protein B7P43_G15147 [Cryptotermes secundus]PNF43679.1 hypothetical protein B7P43_G15147 [Cryptotermes secundus]
MSAGTTTDSGKSTVWRSHLEKPGATIALIRIVGSERIQSMLLDRNTIKKTVWAQVAEELSREGFDLGPDAGKACHQKWRNLKRAYIVYITKAGNKTMPPYMEELQKALETTRKLIKPWKCDDVGVDSRSDDPMSDNDAETSAGFTSLKSSLQFPHNQSVNLAEVLAIVQSLDEDRRVREEAREKREEERFSRIEALLKEQAEQTEKLTNALLEITHAVMGNKKRKLTDSSQES